MISVQQIFDNLALSVFVAHVAGYLNRPTGILCVRMCVLSLQEPVFTEGLMWEWYVEEDQEHIVFVFEFLNSVYTYGFYFFSNICKMFVLACNPVCLKSVYVCL